MDQITHFLNVILAFFREGFNNVNAVEGLVIALVAAIIAPAWDRIWAVALGATVVHLIADVLIPVIARHAAFHLPPLMEFSFWRTALALFGAGEFLVTENGANHPGDQRQGQGSDHQVTRLRLHSENPGCFSSLEK